MKWFADLSTRTKLFSVFALMILFLVIVLGTAYSSIARIQASQRALVEEDLAIVADLAELRAELNSQRVRVLNILLAGDDRPRQEQFIEDIRVGSQRIDDLLGRLQEGLAQKPSLDKALGDFSSTLSAFRQTREEIFTHALRGNIDKARELGEGIQEARYTKMDSVATNMIQDARAQAAVAVRQSSQNARTSTTIFAIVGLLAILVGIVMSLYITRLIADPLTQMADAAERIASGDVNVSIPELYRRDEVGTLAKSSSRMVAYLQRMAEVARRIAASDLTGDIQLQSSADALGSAFREMSDNLRSITNELQDGVSVLASSSSEILAATTEVATSAEETAAAVSETTTTVEEVRQTAQVASEKARAVADTAQKTAEISDEGKAAAAASIDAMNAIQVQMESIAESIMRLSEQSQAIAEIVTTVNDLAEQSNLLAVNAAIEAAKAAEQGKGFAVVAQEIKALADQSKAATAQIREILEDIQKATGGAVLATEQGTKAVASGVKRAGQADSSISALSQSIQQAVQSASQIAAAAQQQFVGMDQIATAMENIREASSQNVASTRESETAARSIHDLGQSLQQLVDRYKV